jgi:hypothetical protein
MWNNLEEKVLRPDCFESTLETVWPHFKVVEDPTTKAFHNWEELWIWNVSSLSVFIDMKEQWLDFSLSCLIKTTKRIVSLSIQEIEFIPTETCS